MLIYSTNCLLLGPKKTRIKIKVIELFKERAILLIDIRLNRKLSKVKQMTKI